MKIAGMVSKKSPELAVANGIVKKQKVFQQKQKAAVQKKGDHFRPPAADEWRALQEGDSKSHYNFFKLQADEFLAAVHRKQEQVQTIVDKWLATFNSLIGSMETAEEKYDLSQRMPWLKKVAVPFQQRTGGIKGSFKFVPPKGKASLIGSQTISASIPCDNTIAVDVAVVMPKEFFQTADYLNFTYHYKKALYMAYVMVTARKSKLIDLSEAQFMFLEDNSLQPVIVLPLADDSCKINIKVQLHFCMESGVYKLNRFIPERNNIRAVTISDNLSEDQETALNNTPTYHYNNSILRDLVVQENHQLMKTLIGKFVTVSDALILLKYWLRRRKMDTVLTSYSLTMLVCHLIKTKKVNPSAMTYYQIIRIFFSHFHLNEVIKEVTLREANSTADPAPTFADIRPNSELCFMDTTGFYNIFSRLTRHDAKRIGLESGKSLQMLDKSHTNAFQWLFLSEAPESIVFDHVFHVVCSEKLQKALRKAGQEYLQQYILFGLDTSSYLVDSINRFLTKGLDNRIQLLQYLRVANRSWSITDSPPAQNPALMFGLILNPENAFDVIIKGPQANDPAANEFREFWGEKSQLRRFKDGSVTEACVFGSSQDCPTEKRLVTAKIVEHLLTQQLAFLGGPEPLWKHQYFANQLTCEIPVDNYNQKYNIPDLETNSLNVLREFNEVEMELRRLEGLALDITGILGTSPIFYYSEPKKNYPNGFCSREENSTQVIYGETVYDAVLTLAVSGKWPEDVEAMKRLKAAFYLEIGSKIRGIKGLFCSVAVDSVSIMRGGYTFRFRLAHSKELQLMRQSVVDGVVIYRDNRESLAMEKDLFIKPTLASALHGLHQQHNAFGPTACLVKHWLNSQLLDRTQWPDECTELLVASLFMDDTKSVTAEAPIQPQAGFLRFLHMIANKNWQTEFVLLNFNATLPAEKVDQIQSHFTMNRSQYPPVTIITSFDNDKFIGLWAKEAPILQVLVRVIMLAKELLVRLTEKIVRREEFCNQSVFYTKFTGYDALIQLDMESVKFLRKNIMQSTTRLPADFNPVEIYLNELRVRRNSFNLFEDLLTHFLPSFFSLRMEMWRCSFTTLSPRTRWVCCGNPQWMYPGISVSQM